MATVTAFRCCLPARATTRPGRQAPLWHHTPDGRFEQASSRGRLGDRGELSGLLDQDQVINPGRRSSRRRHSADPSSSRPEALGPLCAPSASARRNAFGIHHVANQPPRLVAPLVPLALGVGRPRDEIENPISPPNTTAFRSVRLANPTMCLLTRWRRHQAVSENRSRIAVSRHSQQVFHRALPLCRPTWNGGVVRQYPIQTCFLLSRAGRRRGAAVYTCDPQRGWQECAFRSVPFYGSLLAFLQPRRAAAETVSLARIGKAEPSTAAITSDRHRYLRQHGLRGDRARGSAVNHAQLLAAGRLDFNIAPTPSSL